MQNHPGFFYYPSLHDNGNVRFQIIDPESNSVARHLARYVTAPSSLGFTPYIPASSSSPVPPVTPPSSSSASTVNPISAPAEWVSLLATSVAPMLHPTPTPEGDPSRQRRRVTFNPEISINPVSSGTESASG